MKKCLSEIQDFFVLRKTYRFTECSFFSFPKITFEVQKEFLFRHF